MSESPETTDWRMDPERMARIAEHWRSGPPEPVQGLSIPTLRRLVAQIRKDSANTGIHGFSKEAVLSIAAIIEESTPAAPGLNESEPLSELRVVVDYDLPSDEVRVSPRAFSQLQKGLLEADAWRGLKR